MQINRHVLISGRVQGVFFRASTKQKAEQLGVKGWVRNTSDGRVEAVFQGNEDSVKEMIKWCHNGPSLSRVDNIDIEEKQISNKLYDFSIRY
jgi:acylphosphatase